jgi:predicted CXXCH cytochrome family protein
MALLSCTPEQKHRTLTFFFDGVPPLHPAGEPAEKGTVPEQVRKTVERPRVKQEIWSEHEPMKDKASCVQCHSRTRSFSLLKPAAQLCLPCHEGETRRYPRMHGPSAVGDCAVCHDAHRAPRRHLVRAPVVALCFRCHDRTPEGGETLGCSRASDEASCTECHNPHGGDKAYFLVTRPGASPPASDVPSAGEEDGPK